MDAMCTAGSVSVSHMRFLVVDDAPLVRKMTTRLLQSAGVTVDAACNGLEAVAKMKMALALGEPYKAVLMDDSMRLMCGPESASYMRKVGYLGRIYGVTGETSEELHRAFKDSGADRVYVKPLTHAHIEGIIEGMIFGASCSLCK
jgi:CheY-like chemotaxis protein